MPESPLSATEIDDLLSVFGGAKKAAGDGVESLDLDRPNRIPKGIFETLQIRHEQAVRTIRPALRTALGSNIELQLKEISQELFQSFRDRQEEPCCAFVFDMKPLRNPAYLVVDFPFLFACIDRLLGGDGNPEGEGRDLTTTEIAIMSDVLTPIMEATVGVWERYMKLTPVLRRSVSVPRFMREVRFSDAVLVADYEVSEFVSGSGFRLAMPLPGLEGLLQYRRKEPETSEEPSGKTEVRAEIQQHMNRVGLGLQVRLGEASVTVGDVTALEEGDVIVLNRRLGQPLDLLLEGHAKFSGRLLRRGSGLVFRVDGQSSEESGDAQ